MSYYRPSDDLTFTALTAQEEADLFTAFYAGVPQVIYRGRPPAPPRDILIQHHLKYVIKVVLRMSKGSLPEDDAISAGNYGLIKAIESRRFDFRKGYRFTSYLKKYLHSQFLKALSNATWRHPFGERDDIDRNPPDAALTGHRRSRAECQVDLRTGEKLNNLEGDLAVDSNQDSVHLTCMQRARIEEAMKLLAPGEESVVRRVYLNGEKCADVAKKNNTSRQAAQQRLRSGMKKLRAALEPYKNELL